MTCSGCDTSTNATAAPEPLLVEDARAAAMLGIGVSYFRELLKSGVIGPQPVRLGKRQLHRPDLLRAWVEAGLPDRAAWLAMQQGGSPASEGAEQ